MHFHFDKRHLLANEAAFLKIQQNVKSTSSKDQPYSVTEEDTIFKL